MAEMTQRLLSARLAVSLTQKQAAAAIGIHETTYIRWEGGKMQPRTDRLRTAAEVFGVRFAWLLDGDGPRRVRPRSTAVEA